MTNDPQTILARIALLRRVLSEHEPIVFRSVPSGRETDLENKVFANTFERNDRLMRMAETSQAAHRELEATYRVMRVTDEVPDDVAVEVLKVRMRDAGGEVPWCNKMHRLDVPLFGTQWVLDHLADFARGGIVLDGLVRTALMFEDLDNARTESKAA